MGFNEDRVMSVMINDKYYNLNKIEKLIERDKPKKVLNLNLYTCSECDNYIDEECYNHCPHCGQRLKWE